MDAFTHAIGLTALLAVTPVLVSVVVLGASWRWGAVPGTMIAVPACYIALFAVLVLADVGGMLDAAAQACSWATVTGFVPLALGGAAWKLQQKKGRSAPAD